MAKRTVFAHAVENILLLVLAVFLPPCAVACVTGCGMNFALNLIFTLFLSWIGGIIHAICIVVIYGFREEEMPRVRRKARLHAQQKALYGTPPPPPPPRYDTRPAAYAPGSQDKLRAENLHVASRADSGSAYARGSVDVTRGEKCELGMYAPDKAAPGGADYSERPAVDNRDLGKYQKTM